jgi:hypothetical protein
VKFGQSQASGSIKTLLDGTGMKRVASHTSTSTGKPKKAVAVKKVA